MHPFPSSTLRPIDMDDLLARLHERVEPVLSKVSAKIDGYSSTELQRIAAASADLYEKIAPNLKKEGCTEEQIIESTTWCLARKEVIEPTKKEIAKIFEALPLEDPQVKNLLEKRLPITPNYYTRIMEGEFMVKHRYAPLQEQMIERLEPYVKEALAPPAARNIANGFSITHLLRAWCFGVV